MYQRLSPVELEREMRSTSLELLKECDEQATKAREYALAENAYRMAKAQAYLKTEEGTVDYKKARVDIQTEKERLMAHIAEGLLDATRERVRSLRATLSALQTIAGTYKAEAAFDKTAPIF